MSAKRRGAGDEGEGMRPSAATSSLTGAGLGFSDARGGPLVPGRGFSVFGRVIGSAEYVGSPVTGRVLAAAAFCKDEDATGTGAVRPPPLPFHRLHKARHSPSWASPASPFSRIF